MKIDQPWELRNVESRKRNAFPGAEIAGDDGTSYHMDAPRARRLVALWNAHLGVPLVDILKSVKRRKAQLDRDAAWKRRVTHEVERDEKETRHYDRKRK